MTTDADGWRQRKAESILRAAGAVPDGCGGWLLPDDAVAPEDVIFLRLGGEGGDDADDR